jgi:hypothetical protein
MVALVVVYADVSATFSAGLGAAGGGAVGCGGGLAGVQAARARTNGTITAETDQRDMCDLPNVIDSY